MASGILTIKARSVGNSIGFTLPKEVVERMNISAGDSFFLVENADGYQLTSYDPQFAHELTLAAEGMEQYKNALRELAK